MNNNPKTKKNIIVIAAIIVIVIGGSLLYMNTTPKQDSTSTLEAVQSNRVSTRILSLLSQIQSLKIDKSVFSSNAYNSLVDYTIRIPEQNVGRPNPFAPIPGFVIPQPR